VDFPNFQQDGGIFFFHVSPYFAFSGSHDDVLCLLQCFSNRTFVVLSVLGVHMIFLLFVYLHIDFSSIITGSNEQRMKTKMNHSLMAIHSWECARNLLLAEKCHATLSKTDDVITMPWPLQPYSFHSLLLPVISYRPIQID